MRDFINENNISFAEGERNTNVVTLIGYAQHLKLTKSEFKGELKQEIKDLLKNLKENQLLKIEE